MRFYLVKLFFRHAQRLGEVIAEAIPGLSIERQAGWRRRCDSHSHRRVEWLRWDASWFAPSQLHLKPHNHFTYKANHISLCCEKNSCDM